MTSSVADRSSSEALLGTSQPLGRVYMALLCVQLSFSLHYFAAKMVLQEISAPTWAALRVTSGAVLMTLLVLPRLRKHFPSKSDLWKLFIFALFGVTFNQICFTEGLARTTATHSAIINSSIPVSTLLFAILLGRERFSLRKLISICFSLSGVLYLLKIEQLRFSDSQVIGDLLTFTNGMSFAFFLVISKELVSRSDSFVATAFLLIFGSIGITAYSFNDLLLFSPSKVSMKTWIAGAFIVIFPTVLSYFLNYWALKRVESSLVAFFIYIQPVLAALISVLYFGESLTLRMFLSGTMIFFGFFISSRRISIKTIRR